MVVFNIPGVGPVSSVVATLVILGRCPERNTQKMLASRVTVCILGVPCVPYVVTHGTQTSFLLMNFFVQKKKKKTGTILPYIHTYLGRVATQPEKYTYNIYIIPATFFVPLTIMFSYLPGILVLIYTGIIYIYT